MTGSSCGTDRGYEFTIFISVIYANAAVDVSARSLYARLYAKLDHVTVKFHLPC